MKIFKCLSQNVSIAHGTEEKQGRRKYLLGFRQKKRGVGFTSALKENALALAPSLVKATHTPGNKDVTSPFASSRDGKDLAPRSGGSSVAFEERMSGPKYRSRPSVQSTPVPISCKSGKADDSQEEYVDVTTNSDSTTTAFFREMTVNRRHHLPSFAVDQSPMDCREESTATDSSEVNCLNVALIASNSVSDYYMDGHSSYKATDSSEVNCLNVALIASNSVSDSSMGGHSSSTATDLSEVNCLNVALIASNSVSDSSMGGHSSSTATDLSEVNCLNVALIASNSVSDSSMGGHSSSTATDLSEVNCLNVALIASNSVSDSSMGGHSSSTATDSSEVNCLNVALIASNSASDSYMDGHSSSKASMQSSVCDSAADWSCVADNTTCSTAGMANSSTATTNKGCSTSPCFDSSSSYTSVRSLPVRVRPDGRSCERPNVTTRSDTRLSTTAYRGHYYQKPTGVEACASFKEQDAQESEPDASTNHVAVEASICHASVNQSRLGGASLNFTGIDFDASAADDSKFFDKKEVTQQMETTDLSELSVNVTTECPPSSLELKYQYIEQLMSLEQEFVNCMHFGIRKYSKPLQYRILTCHQHHTLFMNIEKLVRISETNLKSMQDNAAPDESQTSVDEHMMLYMPAVIYDMEIQKQCQAYQIYGKKLEKSNKLLTELKQDRKFRDFVKSQHATRKHYKSHPSEWCPSLQEFINKPALHIQQLYITLNHILSVTPQDSHDAPILMSVLDTIINCMKMMKVEKFSECL